MEVRTNTASIIRSLYYFICYDAAFALGGVVCYGIREICWTFWLSMSWLFPIISHLWNSTNRSRNPFDNRSENITKYQTIFLSRQWLRKPVGVTTILYLVCAYILFEQDEYDQIIRGDDVIKRGLQDKIFATSKQNIKAPYKTNIDTHSQTKY